MNPEAISDLIQQIIDLGTLAATKAFELALRQSYVVAAQNIIVSIVFLALIIAWLNVMKPSLYAYFAKDRSTEFEDIKATVQCIILPILLLVFTSSLTKAVGYLINPGWYAIELLITTVTGTIPAQ